MKIGMVSDALPYLPSTGGFRLYGANLIRQLSQRHTIDLIAFVQNGDAQYLDWPRQYCASVSAIRQGGDGIFKRSVSLASAYLRGKPQIGREALGCLLKDAIANRNWDVLHVEGAYAAGLIPGELPVPKVLSLHDSGTLRICEMLKCTRGFGERLYYKLLSYHEPRYERLVYSRFERCTVVADRDRQELQAIVPNVDVRSIPNGIDTEYFRPVAAQKDPYTIVFHGHLGYAPNVEAAVGFANDVLPLIRRQVPAAIFQIVGAEPRAEILELAQRPGIKLAANLPDLRQAVCSAAVYVCPVRHGSGLKNKMLEAMAMSMPIVGYYPGSVSGIDCVPGEHLLVARTPEEFSNSVISLIRNPAEAQRLSTAARAFVRDRHSWESRASAYEDLYLELLDYKRRSLPAEGGRSFAPCT